jgi:hypothetical protein
VYVSGSDVGTVVVYVRTCVRVSLINTSSSLNGKKGGVCDTEKSK